MGENEYLFEWKRKLRGRKAREGEDEGEYRLEIEKGKRVREGRGKGTQE